ncbi:MAG TPA: AAA family ATPase [Candidatus Limnocylindrales bacterium]|nr:AAA family ATPase [Candidatus Limnocylindrales bacterium]
MTIKINKLEIENVKRVKAVKIEPTKSGLTIVGGKNGQGKTSVLDSIAWALGGDKYRPSEPHREGSVLPPSLHLVLSNGLEVERKGRNSDLKVIDPTGRKAGQQLLNEFVEQLALNLPKFMQSTSKEKAATLLQIIGVGEKLYELEQKEAEAYNQRRAIGQIADQKIKFAKEQPYYPDAPKEPVSASSLIKQQQEILAKNGENQRKREQKERYDRELAQAQIALDEAKNRLKIAEQNAVAARKSAEDLRDESTTELEQNIAQVEEINVKVRANLDKEKAEEDATEYSRQYAALTKQIDDVRQAKIDLLKDADLPLPGLSVVDGELTYNGYKWDGMSGSDQLKVAVAIVRKLNPKCGFVLLDKLEQMDMDTLKEFGQWLEAENLQAIATRVSTGEECSIIIQDGYVAGAEITQAAPAMPTWKEGAF